MNHWINLLIIWAVAGAVATAGSAGGTSLGGIPVMLLCAGAAFAIQWLAFVPAYLRQSERFYDLTGSVTYLSVTGFALWASGATDPRSLILAAMIALWALRLGSFLVKRIHQDGTDDRFDAIKPVPLTFFMTWNLQGLWVTLTAACALAAITGTKSAPLGPVEAIGISLWLAGLAIETVADEQKRAHRRQVGPGYFITTGLWAWSRHPNYLGEIMLWTGVALTALPALQGWQWVTLISPVFVAVLLTRISGVNLLEKKAMKKWGHEESYRAYIARTPRLLPWIGRRN